MQQKIVQIDGKDITVKELKTEEVSRLLDTREGAEVIFNLILGNPASMMQLMRKSVEVSDEEFASLTEGINGFSVLEEACREVNSFFFVSLPGKMEALMKLGEVAVKMEPSLKSLASLSKKGT